jgi:hypothetical protein
MRIDDARAHLDSAIRALGIEVHRMAIDGKPIGDHLASVEIELDRMDRALGGGTLLKNIGETVQEAFVEILAARDALKGPESDNG